MNSKSSLNRLLEGNKRYVEDKLDGKLQDSKRRRDLTGSQEPFAIILSCADSRVVPEFVFDCGLGELFVVRVAGNLSNTDAIASIEYAVANCGSKLIVVLGHESCGAVGAAIKGGDNGVNLNHLLGQITPAIAKSGEGASIEKVVKENAKINSNILVEKSAIISEYVKKGEVEIVPGYYNLESGKVDFLQ